MIALGSKGAYLRNGYHKNLRIGTRGEKKVAEPTASGRLEYAADSMTGNQVVGAMLDPHAAKTPERGLHTRAEHLKALARTNRRRFSVRIRLHE